MVFRSVVPLGSQERLADYLRAAGVIDSPHVDKVMRRVDRGDFAPADVAYIDTPQPIGHHQTISAPHMHASCLELLRDHLKEGSQVLDVGAGSGYLTAAMHEMVGDSGRVLGIERFPELADKARANVAKSFGSSLANGSIEIRAGNVLGDALEGEGEFDAIHVGAAAKEMPQQLVAHLKRGGRMVIPVGPRNSMQVLKVVDKDEKGDVCSQDVEYVGYVPLTEPSED